MPPPPLPFADPSGGRADGRRAERIIIAVLAALLAAIGIIVGLLVSRDCIGIGDHGICLLWG